MFNLIKTFALTEPEFTTPEANHYWTWPFPDNKSNDLTFSAIFCNTQNVTYKRFKCP